MSKEVIKDEQIELTPEQFIRGILGDSISMDSPIWDDVSKREFCQIIELWEYCKKVDLRFVYPPIPDRRFDWAASSVEYDLDDPVGSGATKEEALQDFLESAYNQKF